MHVTEAQARRIVRQAYQPGHALVHNPMHRGGGRSDLTLPRYELPTLLTSSLASVVILVQAEERQ